MDSPSPSLMAAFLAGLLAVLSPGGLAALTAYLVAIVGLSAGQTGRNGAGMDLRHQLMLTALCFIVGFSLVLIVSGASATAAGRWFLAHQVGIRKAGAGFIGLWGLFITASLWRRAEAREQGRFAWAGTGQNPGAFFVGAVVGTGWIHCADGELGRILHYAASPETATDGITLLLFYAIGLGLPGFLLILVLRAVIGSVTLWPGGRLLVCTLAGLGLILLSLAVYTDRLGQITGLLDETGIGYRMNSTGDSEGGKAIADLPQRIVATPAEWTGDRASCIKYRSSACVELTHRERA